MESPRERQDRIKRLEQARSARRPSAGTNGAKPEASVFVPGDITTNIPGDFTPAVTPVISGRAWGQLVPTIPTSMRLVAGRGISYNRLFMEQPFVASAVMKMLGLAIRVPLKCYRKIGPDTADREELQSGDHPLADAIGNPYDRAGQAQFVMNTLGPVLIHGNSVQNVEQGASNRITVNPQDWRYSRPIMPFRDSIEGFIFNADTRAYTFERSIDQVLHVATYSPEGPIGVSPLLQLGVTLQIEDAAQRYQKAYFEHGVRPPGAVTMDEKFAGYEPEERESIIEQLREDLAATLGSPENAGKPFLLPPGLSWENAGHTTIEAALIEQRKLAREEVCAVYNIPPPLLGILDHATFSNISVQRDMTYTDCLGPPLILVEQAINSQVVVNLLRENDLFVEFDFGAVLRGDRLQEIDALRGAIGMGMMSPNEGRGVLGLKRKPIPEMDKTYLPLVNNLQEVGGEPVQQVPIALQHQVPNDRPPEGSESRRLHIKSRDADYVLEPA